MKRLTCEMCGSVDLVKQDGLFVCQSCGIKYTPEEAKKMMIEGTVEVQGTVSIDTSKAQNDYLQIIETAVKANNYEDVYNTASKLVEANSNSYLGWFYKGVGAAYISRGGNNRFDEALACFGKAYEVVELENKEKLRKEIIDKTIEIINALFNFYCGLFEENNSSDNSSRIIDCYTSSFKELELMVLKYNMSYTVAYTVENKLSDKLEEMLINSRKTSDAELGRGRENRTDYKFNVWLEEYANIIGLQIMLINSLIQPQNVDKYLSFLQSSIRTRTHTCSYTYSASAGKYVESLSLNRKAVKENNAIWEEQNAKREEIRKNAQERDARYQECRNEEYWKEHSEEKSGLEKELAELENNMAPFNEKIADYDSQIAAQKELKSQAIEEENALAHLKEERDGFKNELKSFSLFDFKGKKPIKDKIAQKEKEIQSAEKVAKEKRAQYNASIDSAIASLEQQKQGVIQERGPAQKRLDEIKLELTKNR